MCTHIYIDPGHCHHLSNPNVLIAYNKWVTNQSTGKKAPYWTHANTHKRTFRYTHVFNTHTYANAQTLVL